jgi:hypothetical protein
LYLFSFTAILGALITITADAIVWYRMLLVVFFIRLYPFKKKTLPNSIKLLFEAAHEKRNKDTDNFLCHL